MADNDETRRARQEALERLWAEESTALSGKRLVPGEGSPLARVMIVGEAPGEREDALGRPFVGRAGDTLDRMLAEAGIARDEVWITNVVKWRPTAQQGGKVTNRPPTVAEAREGERLLRREIDIIKPAIILCLGNSAARQLITPDFKMLEHHGRWYDKPDGVRVIATFHPAYVLRRVGSDRAELLESFRRDFQAVASALRSLPPDP